MSKSVLFVCLGNICRSPTAQGVLQAMVARSGRDWQVDSCGTSGFHNGAPPDARSQAVAAARGYDLSAQRSRQITQGDFSRFDLVVTMDASNTNNARAIAPCGSPAKIVRLLDYLPDQPLRDVPDPYYEDGFDDVLTLIEQACAALLEQE